VDGDIDERDNQSDEVTASADKTEIHFDDIQHPQQEDETAELPHRDVPVNDTGLLYAMSSV